MSLGSPRHIEEASVAEAETAKGRAGEVRAGLGPELAEQDLMGSDENPGLF